MTFDQEVEFVAASLDNVEKIPDHEFEIASALARIVSSGEDPTKARDLVIRTLEHRNQFNGSGQIQNALVREVGLFPYLDPDNLPISDLIAYEFHRPEGLSDEIVFHRDQSIIYRQILDGRNVILSAPTSYGKSLIIDAIIASAAFENIVIVVPTIALIDETRRRLSRFAREYKIITHQSQEKSARNIFVLTQERVIERDDLDDTEFFVIDEFYKLDPGRGDADSQRSTVLNHAFYKLLQYTLRFYMLGPSIQSVSMKFLDRFECNFVASKFTTVASRHITVIPKKDIYVELAELCSKLHGPTMIYCKSPNSARRAAGALVEFGVGDENPALKAVTDWLADEYHPEWLLVGALRRSIGLHHGRVPRALAQFNVRKFNERIINFLVCTSTLIEGVNTVARNVVILDHKVGQRNYDFFTFNNIVGRAGRMFQYFVGNVYMFQVGPEETELDINFPVFDQDANTPASLLVQLDEGDVEEAARPTVIPIYEQTILSLDTIRANKHVDPFDQLELAKSIESNPRYYSGNLAWSGEPTWDQLLFLCIVIFEYFVKHGVSGIWTGKQLAFKVNELRFAKNFKEIFEKQIANTEFNPTVDDAIENSLEFMRQWATFHFPKYVGAVDQIQREILQRHGLPCGDFSVLAFRTENLYLPPVVVALDEYGLPMQIGRKIRALDHPEMNVDGGLEVLRRMDGANIGLTDVEVEFLDWVKSGI